MKKQVLLTLMAFSIFACSTVNNAVTTEKYDSEKGSSYSFNTKATITEAELVLDLTILIKKNSSLLLVNRIVFYKTNYPALFASAMTNNPSLQFALKFNTGVMAMMKKDVTFSNFVNNVSPTPTPTSINQGNVTTFAGSTSGFADAQGTNAQFNWPSGVAVDSNRKVFVVDKGDHKIRKIDSNENVTTLAGSTQGFADGIASSAKFNSPNGVAVDSNGNVFVADTLNHKIRKIDSNGNVTTVAGSTSGFANGQGTNAKFNSPNGVAVDSSGNIFVTDTGNTKIRKIDSNGNVTTFAGSTSGFADGQSTNAQFNWPIGLAVDNNGNVFVADTFNHKIRKIDSNGNVTTFAGSTMGFADGQGTNAQFNWPSGVAVDSTGNIFVADMGNTKIRKIDSNGNVTTVAGSTSGFANGQGTNAQFNSPNGVAVDSSGNIFVADIFNSKIRKIQ